VKTRLSPDAVFPGGVNSPVRAYRSVGGTPPVLERGEGARVWDEVGKSYIDYVGAYGPLVLGHADPEVVEAIARAARSGGSFGVTTAPEIELGEMIQQAMPSVERVRFVNSGTEAAMSALRVARAATGRELVIKFEGGYHGHSDSLLAKAGSGLATLSMPDSAGVTAAVAGQTLIAHYNDLDSVSALFDTHRDRIAAVIVEPVAANMGVVLPASGFLAGLRTLTSQNGALLIFDEVITGFRLARGGAQQLFGVRPDLTILGKIIGGGLPVGAYGGRAELMNLVAPAGPVYQAGTLSGHPVVMAAGAATLRRLTPEFYRRLESTSAQLEAGLAEAVQGCAVVRAGSLLAVFFRKAAPRNFVEASGCDTKKFATFFNTMRERGVLLPPSQFEAWFVSGAHGPAEINLTLRAAAGA
jgi:glutamate-1-semialdehyde 2,1-aminomutase